MIKFIADSTCDMSKELLDKYNVTTFPLHIHLGEESYSDGIDITPDEIYKWSDENKTTPKTSTVSPSEAEEVITRALDEADEVICFTISSHMSSCGSVVYMAANQLDVADKVFVIDSQSLSTGIALQVIEACNMAKNGLSAAEIVEKIEEIKPRVRASFVVDTLTYLHRGGRCSAVAAFAGSALKLHPYIGVEEGKMKPGKKYRGKMKNVIRDYVEDLKADLASAKKDRVFITHSGCDEEILEATKAMLEELNYFDEILITRAGGVITSHCGPGTLGVLFIAE